MTRVNELIHQHLLSLGGCQCTSADGFSARSHGCLVRSRCPYLPCKLLPHTPLVLLSMQTTSSTTGRPRAPTKASLNSCQPPTGTCCTWGAATVCTVAGARVCSVPLAVCVSTRWACTVCTCCWMVTGCTWEDVTRLWT